jgi:hypothetical protein
MTPELEAYRKLRSITAASAESESEAYGGLKEDIHLTGYTFERACMKLEWLLDEGRWERCGFSDVNEFLDSIRLDKFRPIAEARKRIAARIKELQPKASNRAIAKALGVSDMTVGRDARAANAAPDSKKANENNFAKGTNATNVAPDSKKANENKDAAGENVPPSLSASPALKVVLQNLPKLTAAEREVVQKELDILSM